MAEANEHVEIDEGVNMDDRERERERKCKQHDNKPLMNFTNLQMKIIATQSGGLSQVQQQQQLRNIFWKKPLLIADDKLQRQMLRHSISIQVHPLAALRTSMADLLNTILSINLE